MDPFGEALANFGNKEVTDLNQSVSSSTALASDLNSQIPLRVVIVVWSLSADFLMRQVKASKLCEAFLLLELSRGDDYVS